MKNMSIKYAIDARINGFEIKKTWILYDSYSVFQGARMLANDCNMIQEYPASDWDH